MKQQMYRNERGGLFAAQDGVRKQKGTDEVYFRAMYRAPGAKRWVAVPGSKRHLRLADAQAELDSFARKHQLKKA